jgi:hypothetical protein
MPTLELVHRQLHKRAASRTVIWISFYAVVKKLYSNALLYMYKYICIYMAGKFKKFRNYTCVEHSTFINLWDGCRVNLDDQNAS